MIEPESCKCKRAPANLVSNSGRRGGRVIIDRQDVLYAVRSARRTPLLTFVVVLALSVGIGLNAGVFTIL